MTPSPAPRTVTLRAQENARQIAFDHVHFTFASGRLAYDCVSCQSKCCRGHGYLSTVGRELDVQFQMRRQLPLFAFRPSDGVSRQYRIGNCPPACFFLADDGRCEVHTQHGFAAKPETCRLFPFNNLRILGDFLVVSPHLSLCPLEVTATTGPSASSDYTTLLDDMESQGISAQIRRSSCGAVNPAQAIELERQIVVLSEEWLDRNDFLGFAVAQLRASSDARDSLSGDSEQLADIAGVASELFFGDSSRSVIEADANTVRTMVAVTPVLRAQLLLNDVSAEQALSEPPVFSAMRVPHALLWLFYIACLAQHSGVRRITLQTLTRLEQEFRPLLWLLAHFGDVMVWRNCAPIDVRGFENAEQRMSFVRLAKALLPHFQSKHGRTLGTLLMQCAPTSALERVVFLKDVALRLGGRLTPMARLTQQPVRTSVRARAFGQLHRWLLTYVDDEMLKAYYDRVDQKHGLDATMIEAGVGP